MDDRQRTKKRQRRQPLTSELVTPGQGESVANDLNRHRDTMIARPRPSCKGGSAESLEESILPAFREYRRWKRLQLAYQAAHDAPSGSVLLMIADGQRSAGQALLRAADAFIEGEVA